MRHFNVTGLCIAEEDYMVEISNKLEQIKQLVDARCYFTINRARQYGKTTTLARLKKILNDEYVVISISFEGAGDESFVSQESFCHMFLRRISKALAFTSAPQADAKEWLSGDIFTFDLLSDLITRMCTHKKIVLMIDEVDKTSNNRIFIHFLGMLRDKFLARKNGEDHTFHSVILAGVYDIKNIKLKMITAGTYIPSPDENKLLNSPWNIAVDFVVDMSFNPDEIATMLAEYEADHCTGMDIAALSEEIHNHTSGYPYLVSRLCQHIDTNLDSNWALDGVQQAVNIILDEQNMLFDDMFKNLESYKDLYDFVYSVLIVGEQRNFVINDPLIGLGVTFGFLKNTHGKVAVANKIFEATMTNYYVSKESRLNPDIKITKVLPYDVVKNGRFDMELCLRKFAKHYAEIFNERDIKFFERHGHLLFLSYLKPLINGHGCGPGYKPGLCHIESQFTDLRRMDIVVDFGPEQFLIELKLWHGDAYKQEAYAQLLGYMAGKNADTGYLLTFDFRKDQHKQPCAQWISCNGKRIFDMVV
ncbi:MAG: AAA-like domain-containing protein [Peptococcaceae bacterium]|nr:AAA-like domain-containing protein [Peptococcaceae bacterium]